MNPLINSSSNFNEGRAGLISTEMYDRSTLGDEGKQFLWA